MQIHAVDPDFIRELIELGYRDLSAFKLLLMRIHDITPEYIRRLANLGYKDLSAWDWSNGRSMTWTPIPFCSHYLWVA